MKPFGLFAMGMFIGLLLSSDAAMAQKFIPTTHTILMAVIEIKDGTSPERLAPPPVNPKPAFFCGKKNWRLPADLFGPRADHGCDIPGTTEKMSEAL
jgi:hypothetical protein